MVPSPSPPSPPPSPTGAGGARLLPHALDLEEDPGRLPHRDPTLGIALSAAHSGLGRLLGDRLIGKDPNPHLPAALHRPADRDSRRLDLPIGDPARLERGQRVLTERDGPSPVGDPAGLALELL